MKTEEPDNILSNWKTLIRGLSYSSEEFYKSLEERIARHELPSVNQSRVEFKEGPILSKKRKYLRVIQGDLIFDICGAPYGVESFFVSYWLGTSGKKGCFFNLLLLVPLLGEILEKTLQPMTYYQIDTASMFQSLIHDLILEEIDEITTAREIEPLTDELRVANTKKLDQF